MVDELVATCRRHDVHVAMGLNEREPERPGTVYNTLILLGPAASCGSTAS